MQRQSLEIDGKHYQLIWDKMYFIASADLCWYMLNRSNYNQKNNLNFKLWWLKEVIEVNILLKQPAKDRNLSGGPVNFLTN